MEVFAVRVRPEKFFRDTLSTDIRCALIGFHPFCPAWLLIIGPVLAVQERMQANHLQTVFVYGERDEVLYFYDHGSTPADRYEQAMSAMASPFENLDATKCFDLEQCVTDYIEEARKRAGEVGYAMTQDEHQIRQFYRMISRKVDEGMITKEASRKIRKPSEYLFPVYKTLNDFFLKEIDESKCPRLTRCVSDYVQEMRAEALIAGYTLTAMDEEYFQSELEIAREADQGNITKEVASSRLGSIATKRLVRLFNVK